jgi:serine/threonine protein kinase
LPYRQKSERKEAFALQQRMFRIAAIIEKYINNTGKTSLKPYKKVRGIFVFPEGADVRLLAKDANLVNAQADVRALPLDKLVASIETDQLLKSAQPISKSEVLKLSEVVDRGIEPALSSPRATAKVIGQYKLEGELYKDQAPNGLNFSVLKVKDLNTGIDHRGKYYDWSPMDNKAQAVWTEQVQRHKNALSALSANRRIHQIITALKDEEGYGYLVIESWMKNPTLNELLNNPRELKKLDLNRFMLNLALGVRAVHERKFVHRELSPKSIFVEVDESDAIITNFELAKMLTDKVAPSSREIPTVFTRQVPPNAYRAPEIAVTPHDVDVRADIYSWGSIYFRLITGHQFNNEPKAFDQLAASQAKDESRTLIEKCLEADPADRPKNIEEIIALMQETIG